MTNTATTPDPRFNASRFYDIYALTIHFRGRIMGGLPKDPDLLESAKKAQLGHDDERTAEIIEAEKKARFAESDPELVLNEEIEKSWNTFHSEPEGLGLYIPARNVKAMLKQSASVLKITMVKRGSKQILAEGMEVKNAETGGDRIYLGRMKPDGQDEGPIHVMTAQGPRTSIKREDYVEGATITFHVWVLATHAADKRHIGEDDLINILTHAQENGLGASRSQGAGKFDVVSFERIHSGQRVTPEPEAKPVKAKRGKANESTAEN